MMLFGAVVRARCPQLALRRRATNGDDGCAGGEAAALRLIHFLSVDIRNPNSRAASTSSRARRLPLARGAQCP